MENKAKGTNKQKIIDIIKENVILVILVLVALWSILLMLDVRQLQKDVKQVSTDIEQIREEQALAADKLKQWREEIEKEPAPSANGTSSKD